MIITVVIDDDNDGVNDDVDEHDDDERTCGANADGDDHDDDDNKSNESRVFGTSLLRLGHRWTRFNNKSARRSLIAQALVHLTPRPATHDHRVWVCSHQWEARKPIYA